MNDPREDRKLIETFCRENEIDMRADSIGLAPFGIIWQILAAMIRKADRYAPVDEPE